MYAKNLHYFVQNLEIELSQHRSKVPNEKIINKKDRSALTEVFQHIGKYIWSRTLNYILNITIYPDDRP